MNKQLLKAYAAKLTAERGLKVKMTPQQAEGEIVQVIYKVARTLAPTFRFGYHSVEDIEQTGVFEALKVLETSKYDVGRPLENFLYTHVHNQLHNYKRKHYARLEPPCSCCDPTNLPAYPCQKWLDWSARNAVKQNLMQPLDMSNISDESECRMHADSSIVEDSIGTELRLLLDRELPVDIRRDYLQMLEGKVIPKVRREKVREVVLSIIKTKGYLDDAEEENSY